MIVRTIRQSKSDFLGIFSAGLCTVHCLAAPVLLALFSTHDWFHTATYVFLIISIYAAYQSTRYVRSLKVRGLIWFGLALLTVSVLFEHEAEWLHDASYFASASLIGGHLLNIRQGGHQCRVH